jgi:hypothetical protein
MRILLSLVVAIPMFAQQPPDAAHANRPAPQAPKNLKLLKPEEVRPMMGAFRTALGVQCNACHVQGNFASDDNPKKEVARNMIVMMREINAKFPDGKMHVSCYTCHRGSTEPAVAPPADGAAPGAPAAAAPPPPPPPPPAQ